MLHAISINEVKCINKLKPIPKVNNARQFNRAVRPPTKNMFNTKNDLNELFNHL